MERSLSWDGSAVVAVDQRALPREHRTMRLRTVPEIVEAIERLAVRGAPAIGVAGGLGVALSALQNTGADGRCDEAAVFADADLLANARPTAVNLRRAVERVLAKLHGGAEAVLDEALTLIVEDELTNRAAAARAAALVRKLCPARPLTLLTHCNTGRFATVSWGTALGTIRELAATGDVREVLFGETRPLLQGSRLTAWELAEADIPHRLCVDSAGPSALARGLVDCVLVGADRVCANGDVANKVGTYPLALAAQRAGVPFIVVAPESTVDNSTPSGELVVIEDRPAAEVTGIAAAPPGTGVFNPAFDITPADLVTAVVTDNGVRRPWNS